MDDQDTAHDALRAALPHLLAPLRELAGEWTDPQNVFRDVWHCTYDLREALDRIESEARP